MDVRAAISRWAGAGATRNARASLDEWNRAQEEVSAMLVRLADPDTRPSTEPRAARRPGLGTAAGPLAATAEARAAATAPG